MKKILSYMFIATMAVIMGTMASCSKDELPNVKITLDVNDETASVVNDTIYVQQGDTIKIDAVKITSLEEGKSAAINKVEYFWDGIPEPIFPVAPYPYIFPIPEDAKLVNHAIGLRCQVLVVDFPICFAYVEYPVKVIAKGEPLPKGDNKPLDKNTNLE